MKEIRQQERKLKSIEQALAKKEQEVLELSQKWREEKETLEEYQKCVFEDQQKKLLNSEKGKFEDLNKEKSAPSGFSIDPAIVPKQSLWKRVLSEIKMAHETECTRLLDAQYRQEIMSSDTGIIVTLSFFSFTLGVAVDSIGFSSITSAVMSVFLSLLMISSIIVVAVFAHGWKPARDIEKREKLKERSKSDELKWKGKLNTTLSTLIKRKVSDAAEIQKTPR